jgi:hypothetical protein
MKDSFIEKQYIFPRRYFYPSLNLLPYLNSENMLISEHVARKILCLPLYAGLDHELLINIISLLNNNI